MNSHVHPDFQEALRAISPDVADLLGSIPPADRPLATHRTASVVVAAIKTGSLTVNEMGNILGAITERICNTALGKYSEYPELKEVAHDLSDACEAFTAAQDKIEERKCNQECSEIEEGDWK